MAGRVKWDEIAEKFFEGGCSKGMCYNYNPDSKEYDHGEAWNGISGFTDNPSGADEQASYADNIKYISMRGAENYGFTVKCFFYPDNFKRCLGKKEVTAGVTISQQAREAFGFCVTTQVGNDTQGVDYAETLHIVWNATTSPSSKDYSSLNESPSPSELSFEATANPIAVGTLYKPTANMEICTAGMDSTSLGYYNDLCDILYGSDTAYAEVPASAEAPSDWAAGTAAGKYYTRSGSTYTAVESGTTWSSSTTYYTKGVDPRLPLPKEIIEDIFHGTVDNVSAQG